MNSLSAASKSEFKAIHSFIYLSRPCDFINWMVNNRRSMNGLYMWICYLFAFNSNELVIDSDWMRKRQKNKSNNGTALSINLNFVAANNFNGISVMKECIRFYFAGTTLNKCERIIWVFSHWILMQRSIIIYFGVISIM